ncbi:sugar ABC transporter permease [Acrocarpospora phusangensis]|uniref:Sugar ABC transporter permease n=1 Tax=Acrocarpospora phusangensis TaxID=1070424 RepID=A0A919QCT2_9ACTN|nr:carbohydrate ABC transporter permease [Acrocarpospora phusangensis]GIH25063.1 sugar ABC transporter permease [Acrocarpospora phusangensis]
MAHHTSGARRRFRPGRILAWTALALLLLVTLYPFVWMLRTAFTGNRAIFNGDYSLIPADPTLVNYSRVLGHATAEESIAAGGSGAEVDFWLYLRNSVIFTLAVVAGQVGFSATAAYAFARLRFRGRDTLFAVFLTGLMVPPIFTVLPNFALVRDLGWLDTFPGLLAPYLLMTPFAIFFLRQFFLGISPEIEDAATIDGAGKIAVFWRIILPMSTAPLATLAVITAVFSWNEYLWPQLVGKDEGVRLLNVALGVFAQSSPTSSPDWAGLMAAASLQVIPVLLLLIVFGRRLVNSIGFTGIK